MKQPPLANSELAIMDLLWSNEPLTARQIREQLYSHSSKAQHGTVQRLLQRLDEKGYIWIFSTSHGKGRPSYVHRSKKPYDIEEFELIKPVKLENSKEIPITNFSYMQPWYIPQKGFIYFFTLYGEPAVRTIFFARSKDGIKLEGWTRLAAIQEGHYQISIANANKAGTTFNFHPKGEETDGLEYRTNLYYLETIDLGKTWQAVDGEKINLPLTQVKNSALVYDYQKEGLNVYLKDIQFDKKGKPVILYLTSKGWENGNILLY